MQTTVTPVDLSKFTDVHVLNMSLNPRVPVGYVILGIYPGQYLQGSQDERKETVVVPPSYAGGTYTTQTQVHYEAHHHPLATSFMLVGKPEHMALGELHAKLSEYGAEIVRWKDTNKQLDADKKELTQSRVAMEALFENEKRTRALMTEDRNRAEKLANDLRKDLETLTKHFGEAAVRQALGKAPA
jgi:uncharacterized protein with von Willebrand factor type A (vWA) domain